MCVSAGARVCICARARAWAGVLHLVARGAPTESEAAMFHARPRPRGGRAAAAAAARGGARERGSTFISPCSCRRVLMTSSGLVKMHAVAVALPPVAISVSSLRESAMRAGWPPRSSWEFSRQKKRGSKKRKFSSPFLSSRGMGFSEARRRK